MKKILLMGIATLVMANASSTVKRIDNGVEYKVTHGKKANYIQSSSKVFKISKSTSLAHDKKALKTALRITAKEVQKDGYKYFVLLNRDVSNVNGFPINRVNELSRYISLRKRNSDYYTSGRIKTSGIIMYGSLSIKYKPMTSKQFKNSFLTVWSVKQTLKDTK